jgi:hypothetical protein
MAGQLHLGMPLLEVAAAFGAATAVIGSRGNWLVNIMYCEAGTPIFMLPSFDALSREYEAQGVPPPPPPPPLSSSKTTREVQRDEIAPSDGYFTYLAAALDLPLTLLAHRRAHPYGNFSVPPYLAAKLAQSVEKELIKVGRWRAPPPLPGQRMNSKTEGKGAAAARPNAPPPQADTPSAKPRSSASKWFPSFLLPFTTTQPPPPLAPPPPPRALPPPKPPARPPPAPAPPLPATGPAAAALTTPSATTQQRPGLVKIGINEAGQAGLVAGSRAFAGLSALETPFGRGFRLVLPDTLGESLGSTALGGEPLGGASHGEGHGDGDGDGSTGVGASGAVARGDRQPLATAAGGGSSSNGRSGGGSSSSSSDAGGAMAPTPPDAATTATIPAARNILSMPPPPRPPRIATPNIAARPPPPPLDEAEDDVHDVAEAEPRKDEPPVQRHLGTFNTLDAAADAVAKAYKKAGGKPHSHQYPAGLQAEARQSEKPKKLKAGGAANGDAPESRQTVTLTIGESEDGRVWGVWGEADFDGTRVWGEADPLMLGEKQKMVDASVAANRDAPEPLLPPSPPPQPPPLHIHIDHSAAIPAKDAHESCREGSRGCDASKPVSMSAESTSEEAAAFTLFVRNSAMFSTAFTLREARVLAGALAQESGAKPGIKPGMSGQSVRDAVRKIQEERVAAGYPLSEDDSLYSRMLHSKASAAAAAAAAVAAWEASQEDSASYEASLATPSPKGVAMTGKEVSRSANFALAVELASQMHEVLVKLDVDERTTFRSTDQWLHVLGDLVSQEHSLRKFIQA